MGVSYLAISTGYTILSFVGLVCWAELSLDKLRSENLTGGSFINLEKGKRDFELLSVPFSTIALVVNCVFNVFILVNVCVKGLFLPLVIPPTIIHGGLWVVWLTVLCSLKYGKAVQESVYEQLHVVREGQLRIIFSHNLKILSWEFCAWRHEKLLPRRVVAPQVNQFVQVAQKCQSMIAETGTDGVSQQDLQTNSNMYEIK